MRPPLCGLSVAVLLAGVRIDAFVVIPAGQSSFVRSAPPSYAPGPVCMVGDSFGKGWDNDNFLESLGNGDDALADANEEYTEISNHRARMRGYSDGWAGGRDIDREGEGGEEPKPEGGINSAGGQMYQKMMATAKATDRPQPQLQQNRPSPPPSPAESVLPPCWGSTTDPGTGRTYYYNTATGETRWDRPLPPPTPLASDARLGASGAATTGQTASPGKPYIPTLQEQFGTDSSRRNAELHKIVNVADVYLAQLKRDSTVRKIQRMAGGVEAANDVMADGGVQELNTWVQKNPHAVEEKKQWTYVGPVDEPELTEEQKSHSGISYKQKIAEVKRRKEEGR